MVGRGVYAMLRFSPVRGLVRGLVGSDVLGCMSGLKVGSEEKRGVLMRVLVSLSKPVLLLLCTEEA